MSSGNSVRQRIAVRIKRFTRRYVVISGELLKIFVSFLWAIPVVLLNLFMIEPLWLKSGIGLLRKLISFPFGACCLVHYLFILDKLSKGWLKPLPKRASRRPSKTKLFRGWLKRLRKREQSSRRPRKARSWNNVSLALYILFSLAQHTVYVSFATYVWLFILLFIPSLFVS